MIIEYLGEWYAYKANKIDCIGVFPSRALAEARLLTWEGIAL